MLPLLCCGALQLWMAESFSSQYRDSCKLVLFDYMFYPACEWHSRHAV
jgi:hypothetical protein